MKVLTDRGERGGGGEGGREGRTYLAHHRLGQPLRPLIVTSLSSQRTHEETEMNALTDVPTYEMGGGREGGREGVCEVFWRQSA